MEQLIKIIKEYELALQKCEIALKEAQNGENCGIGGEFLTDQEIAYNKYLESKEQVRQLAKDAGIELPKYSQETERIKRDISQFPTEMQTILKQQWQNAKDHRNG